MRDGDERVVMAHRLVVAWIDVDRDAGRGDVESAGNVDREAGNAKSELTWDAEGREQARRVADRLRGAQQVDLHLEHAGDPGQLRGDRAHVQRGAVQAERDRKRELAIGHRHVGDPDRRARDRQRAEGEAAARRG